MSKDDQGEIGTDLLVESGNLYGLLEVICRLFELRGKGRLSGPSRG